MIIIDGLNASWHLDPVVAEHLRSGDVTAVNATIAANHDSAWTFDIIGRVLSFIAEHSDSVSLVETAPDIRTAGETGRIGYVLGFQDTMPLGESLHLLPVFHKLGVRVIQLTYNFENLVGCGCQCEDDQGLTAFGYSVVEKLNALGILIDLSHCGPRTSVQAVEASTLPVAITHANSTTTAESPRNKSPELIRKVATSGGMIGAVAVAPLLTASGTATLANYIDAIDELVSLVGTEHVGIGPDFMEAMPDAVAQTVLSGLSDAVKTGFTAMSPVEGLASPADYPRLVDALSSHGYSDADVRLIMGENWLRLYERVWDGPQSGGAK